MQFIYYMRQNTAIRRGCPIVNGYMSKTPIARERDALVFFCFREKKKEIEIEIEKCLK